MIKTLLGINHALALRHLVIGLEFIEIERYSFFSGVCYSTCCIIEIEHINSYFCCNELSQSIVIKPRNLDFTTGIGTAVEIVSNIESIFIARTISYYKSVPLGGVHIPSQIRVQMFTSCEVGHKSCLGQSNVSTALIGFSSNKVDSPDTTACRNFVVFVDVRIFQENSIVSIYILYLSLETHFNLTGIHSFKRIFFGIIRIIGIIGIVRIVGIVMLLFLSRFVFVTAGSETHCQGCC